MGVLITGACMVIKHIITFLLIILISLPCFASNKVTYGLMKSYFKKNLEDDDLETIYEHDPKILGKMIKKLSENSYIINDQKRIERFLSLLTLLEENVENDDLLDIIEKINSRMNDRIEFLVKNKKGFFSFATVQYNSWQDGITVSSLSGNDEQSYKVMNRGPCLGGGAEYGNLFYRLGIDLCLGGLIVFTNTQSYYESLENGKTVFKSFSGVETFYVKSDLYYRYFVSDKSSFSLGLPVIFRITDFVLAPQTQMDGTTYFNVGLNLGYHFKLYNNLNFYTSVGGFFKSGALAWSNGLNWLF